MKNRFSTLLLAACPITVTLDPALTQAPVSGRLLLVVKPGAHSTAPIPTNFLPEDLSLGGSEVSGWKPGTARCIDEKADWYREPEAGKTVSVMAVLDRDHSYARDRRDGGDYYSATVPVAAWGKPVSLRLTQVTPQAEPLRDTEHVKLVEFRSPKLSAFWKRPIVMRAGVVLPSRTATPMPAVFHIHGFGDNHSEAWREAARYRSMPFQATHIFLDGSWTYGHHVFADSVNNGPWATALVTEFIPYLEKRFGLAPNRYLMGHSSGGWSSLWLQVNYPDFFGGAWPTSPDSVDFRDFSGVDFTPGSKDNVFDFELVRGVMGFEEFWRFERAAGPYGGPLNSFNWVFGPKGPVSAFDAKTGKLNPQALEHWKRYDIGLLVRERWPELGPKLHGKIRLVIGTEDTFHLEGAAVLLCDWLREQKMDDACEIIPGRDHFDVLSPSTNAPRGMLLRINEEMGRKWASR